jgi:cytochrome P450
LHQFPEIRKKLEDELQALKYKTIEQITAADLKSLNYLNAFLKETLRLYSPFSFGFRKTLETVQLNVSAK